MDPLGDPLTIRPILTGWEFTTQPYPSWQFGFIDDLDRQFGNGSVWTRTRTRSDGPEPSLTLHLIAMCESLNTATVVTLCACRASELAMDVQSATPIAQSSVSIL